MTPTHADAEPVLIKSFNKLVQAAATLEDEMRLKPTQMALRQLLELKSIAVALGEILADNVTTSNSVRSQVVTFVHRYREELRPIQRQLDAAVPIKRLEDMIAELEATAGSVEDEADALIRRDIGACFDQIARDSAIAALGMAMASTEPKYEEFAAKGVQSLARFRKELSGHSFRIRPHLLYGPGGIVLGTFLGWFLFT